MADIFRARAVDTTEKSFVFEVTGVRDKVKAFVELMGPLGKTEVCRTGIVAVKRGDETI
nr:hypothetical protein [Sneathiella glossodoripedis]